MKKLAIVFATAAVLLSIFAFGCALPQVKYHSDDPGLDNDYVPFALMGSRVTIGIAKAAGGSDATANTVNSLGITNRTTIDESDLQAKTVIGVTQAQAPSSMHYIEPEWNLLYKTHITVTYFKQLKVPQTINTEVEDNTVKLINAAGGLAAAAAPLLMSAKVAEVLPAPAAPTKPIDVPIIIDFSDPTNFDKDGSDTCTPLDGINGGKERGYCYTYTLSSIEGAGHKSVSSTFAAASGTAPAKVTAKDFFSHFETTYTDKMPFSSCVNVTLHIRKFTKTAAGALSSDLDPSFDAIFQTVIADPQHVDWLPMPVKGSITLEAACGADSKSDTSTNPDVFAVMDAVSQQVTAVSKAIKGTSTPAAAPAK